MSRIGASARRYYSDGITRVTDPFWKMKCNKCGHVFLSCICIAECPTCGSMDQKAFLDGKSLEEIKAKLEEHGLTLGMTDYSHLKDVDLGKHKDENE